MSLFNVTFQVDENLKKQAEVLFANLNMSLEEALNIFLEQSVHEQRIPFNVTENVPNEITFAAIESAQKGKDMYGPFESMDDLINALNS